MSEIPWDKIPESVRRIYKNRLERKVVPLNDVFQAVIQMPPVMRLSMLTVNLAEFLNRFVPQEKHEEFIKDFTFKVKETVKECSQSPE